MSTLTRTVKVYKQGALVRITTTAREALRASMLPTAGMTHADRLALANGETFSETRLASLRKKAERNAVTIGEREVLEVIAMQEATQARLASERGDVFGSVERDYEGANLHD